MNNWNQNVANALKSVLDSQTPNAVAVFDADGTLWPDDLGEAFFKHQIQHQLAPAINKLKNPWESYQLLDRVSVADANAWIAKMNAGLQLQTVREQARDFYENHFKNTLNPMMRDLIRRFKEKGVSIWICSASFRWAIEPALYDLDLPLENLVATESEINSNGILTQIIKMPVPYGEGKKISLSKKIPQAPLFVAGNSIGDLAMMEWGEVPLVIQYLPTKPEIEGSSLALRREAEARGWLTQTFQR